MVSVRVVADTEGDSSGEWIARAALEEALRREGVQPIRSADDLACEGIFDTDEELDEFLEFTYAARRADIA